MKRFLIAVAAVMLLEGIVPERFSILSVIV